MMNTYRHTAWQRISAHRLTKAAATIRRNTSPDLSRRPNSIQWLEWSAAMCQAMAFGVDAQGVIERAK